MERSIILLLYGAIGLMLSHTISTFYTAIFAVAYILFYVKKLKEKGILEKLCINILFILFITAFFWLPMLEAKTAANYAIFNNSIMSTNSKYVQENTLEFYQIFTEKEEENGTTFRIGIPTLLFLVASIYTTRKVDKKYKDTYIIFMLFAYISLVMCFHFFPWKWLPNILCKLQYAWRMMGFFDFFIAFICGVNIVILLQNFVKKEKWKYVFSIVFILVSVTYTLNLMQMFQQKDATLDKEYEEYIKNAQTLSHFQINREYLPVNALNEQRTYMLERKDKTYLLEGDTTIIAEEKEDLHMQIQLEDLQAGTRLEFAYIYYPGYQITLEKENGESIELKAVESEHGYLSAVITEDIENATIHVDYVSTWITKISYGISLVALIGFCFYTFKQNKKEKANGES
mgnify:CR=1 FL=1